MIKSFAHKGLQRFFFSGSTAGISAAHAKKIAYRLAVLHRAKHIEDVALPGFALHPLRGDKKGLWAISVSGNWRIVFKFEEGDAHVVDYMDYH